MLHYQTVEPATLGLLKRICEVPELNSFLLVGGTNLALRFGHRVSVDLDFFTSEKFNPEQVVSTVARFFRHFELVFQKNQTLIFDIENVRVDFVWYPFEWLHPFDNIDGMRLAHIEDIIPMKIQGLENRKSKKDFWDIACLLDVYSMEQMMEIMKKKFPFVDIGHLIHSFTHFDDADQQPDPMSLNGISWNEVKRKIETNAIAFTRSYLR